MTNKKLAAALPCLLGSLALLAAGAGTAATKADDEKQLQRILECLDRTNEKLHSISADIEHRRSIEMLGVDERSSGKLHFKKPQLLRVEFTKPEQEKMTTVVNGKEAWIYYPVEKQAERYPMEQAGAKAKGAGFLKIGFGASVKEVEKTYDISLMCTEIREKEKYFRLRLKPKARVTDAPYSEVQLLIDSQRWLPVEIKLYESNGEIITTIRLKNIEVNPKLKRRMFKFKPPKGVEIVEPI